MFLRFDPTRLRRRPRELPGTRGPGPVTLMPMEGYRHGDNLVMHIDLLGAPPETVALTLDEGRLMLNAQSSGDDLVPAGDHLPATLRQELSMGENLDHDNIEARFSDGVLTITVPFVRA